MRSRPGRTPDFPATWSPRDVIERALASVAEKKATWTRSDLTRAVSDALPGELGVHPDQVLPLLKSLTDEALAGAVRVSPDADLSLQPAEYRLADGGDAFARPGSERFTTEGQVRAEQQLRAAAIERGAHKLSEAEAARMFERYAENGIELGADQAAALRGVLTSGARVEVLAAAAGTGKSYVVGAIAAAWREQGRQVYGLAPSQVAADVLTDEGVTSANITRWLSSDAPLGEGDIVVVDEAGMASTTHLAAIHERCERAGAKLLLVGDPRQLGAVGPGGALADLAERAARYELAEVRRFTAGWERTASLGLRDGDKSAVAEYAKHGRIVDGGTLEQAEAAGLRAWLADTLAGRDSLLVVGSNEAAARVSAAARAELVRLGRLDEAGVALGRDGNTAGVGDLVQARRNGWELANRSDGRVPINRSTYRVVEVRGDGGLQVAPLLGHADGRDVLGEPIGLPAGYVAEHLTLGYASTVHAAQGRTVDTAHAVLGGGTDAAGAYVGLTRGRDGNWAYMVTRAVPEDSPAGEASTVEPRAGSAVLGEVLQRSTSELSALEETELEEVEARSVKTNAGRLILGISHTTAGHTSAALDRLAASGVISEGQRQALAADEAMGAVERVLRRAELAGHQRDQVLTAALARRTLDGAQSPAQVLHHRINEDLDLDLIPKVASFADLIPATVRESHRPWLEQRADAADDRRRELGSETADSTPQWALEALGPVPADPVDRAEWEHRAGWAAAYREMADHTDEASPLGPAPPSGLAEQHAIWRAAHAALDLPDAGADEGEMTDGRLRARVQAWEREKVWAPRWVGDELETTSREAEKARQDAEIWAASTETSDSAVAARARAEELSRRAAELEAADQARSAWYAHTAVTRDAAERSVAELGGRGVDLDDPGGRVTAQEWLDAHQETVRVEDEHRAITDLDTRDDAPVDESTPETAVPDIRDTARLDASESADPAERHRVPTVDETAAAVARAQDALVELEARRQDEQAREAEEAAERDAYRRTEHEEVAQSTHELILES